MKLKMKRVASLGLALVMSLSLMACGSKSTSSSSTAKSEDTKEILTKVAEASKDIKSLEGNSEFEFKLSAGGQEMMSMSGKAVVQSTTEPQNMYTKFDASYSAMGQEESMNEEMYEVVDDKIAETYEKKDGQWKYNAVDMSQYSGMIDQVKSAMEDFDYDKVKDYVDKISAEKDGDEYSIVVEASVQKILDKVDDTELSSKLATIDMSQIPNVKIVATIKVDASTYLPSAISVKLESEEFEIQGIQCKIDSFKFETKLDKYGEVEVKVPDEALAAKDE